MSVTFGDRVVGDGAPCFVTFEAGPTHNGLESAKRLIDLAADAGADAVKFQIFDVDRLVADRSLPFSYDVLLDKETGAAKTVEEPLYDLLKRRCLPQADWRALKAHAAARDLAFFSTVAFEDDIDFIVDLGCDSIKIASADVDHTPLLRQAARTGLCIQLDTGNATLGEIEAAVDVIRAEGNDNLIIHHCPSGYPARLDGVNLNVVKTLKQLFPYPVAYSDHSPGWEMDVAALAMGADLVEKTITEDRMTPSVEHIMSLEPGEMRRFIQVIRDVEAAMGTRRRALTAAEREKRKAVRRSAFLAADSKAGTPMRELPIEYRRPGFGLTPNLVDVMGDARLKADTPRGRQLAMADFV